LFALDYPLLARAESVAGDQRHQRPAVRTNVVIAVAQVSAQPAASQSIAWQNVSQTRFDWAWRTFASSAVGGVGPFSRRDGAAGELV